MLRWLVAGTLVVCVCAAPQSAHALPVTIQVAGVVDSTTGLLPDAVFLAGQSLVWTLTYDTDRDPGPPGQYSFNGDVPRPLFDWQVAVAGRQYRWSGNGQTVLSVWPDTSGLLMDTSLSGIATSGDPLPGPPLTLFPLAFDASVFWSSPFGSNALPSNVDEGVVNGSFSLMFAPCSGCSGPSIGFVQGSFSQVNQVPEPSVLAMLVLGVAGAVRLRTRRRR